MFKEISPFPSVVNTVAANHDADSLILPSKSLVTDIFDTPSSAENSSSDDETECCGGGVTVEAFFLQNAKNEIEIKNDQNLYRVRAIILVCIQMLNKKPCRLSALLMPAGFTLAAMLYEKSSFHLSSNVC